jgi:hypothetical protein
MADNELQQGDPLLAARERLSAEPGWEYGTILPMRWRGEGAQREHELATPEMIRSLGLGALQLLEGPRRAGAYLRGEVGAESVVPPNALLTLGGGGTGLAQTAPKGAIGVFGGPLARTADLEALEAARRVLSNAQPDAQRWERAVAYNAKGEPVPVGIATRDQIEAKVWEDLGWTNRTADKKWRFEIADDEAKLNPEITDIKWIPGTAEKERWGAAGVPRLGDLLDHPKLFEAYPWLKDMRVYDTGMNFGLSGAYSEKAQKFFLDSNLLKRDPEEARKTLLHEIQHAIQAHEGFARGGNTEQFLPPFYKDAVAGVKTLEKDLRKKYILDDYTDLHGEARDRLRDLIRQEGLEDYPISMLSYLSSNGANPAQKAYFVRRDSRKQLTDDEIDAFERQVRSDPYMADFLKIEQSKKAIAGLEKAAFDKYRALAGEVESRLVEDRSRTPAGGLRRSPPWQMLPEDLALERQIVHMPQETVLPNGEKAFLVPVQGNPFAASVKGWHGSPSGGITRFAPESHFGTKKAAQDRLDNVMAMPEEARPPMFPAVPEPSLYRVRIDGKRREFYKTRDQGEFFENSPELGLQLLKQRRITQEEFDKASRGEFSFTDRLRQLGYKGIRYANEFEDKGRTSFMVFDPQDVLIVERGPR